ncbi:MAG: excinuclease ABC subunit UvrC [Clostridia bacterium]|nr:excinuclease ABC subunit UvrC [Clostridia bacterium]
MIDLKEKIKQLPTQSGVYVMYSSQGSVIYVGKAKNLKNRVSQYFSNTKKQAKVMAMVEKIANFEYFITPSERDAFALENNLIKKYQPFYNILLKDDKAYPYIKVNIKEKYPRFEVVRRITKKPGNKYFGPYISGISPYALIKAISLAYPIRTCKSFAAQKSIKRACLNYSLGLCCAPCVGLISEQDYKTYVQNAINFLCGNDDEIERILEQKMQNCVASENFEKAIEIRDMLKMIAALKQKVVSSLPKEVEYDVFSYVSDGLASVICVLTIRHGKILGVENFVLVDASLSAEETLSKFIIEYYTKHQQPKEIITNFEIDDGYFEFSQIDANNVIYPQKAIKKQLALMAENNAYDYLKKYAIKQQREFSKTIGALESLQKILGLKNVPNRMECFDISNISGTNKVAAMTVSVGGRLNKDHYRKFIIKTVAGQDDFECLKEALTRRLNELSGQDVSFSTKPDLLVIDGGKGQLSACKQILEQFGLEIDIISLAEKFEEVFTPHSSQPIMLPRGSNELFVLQNLRDEAHRFAITFHRKKRLKQMTKSPLDDIKGLGQVKKQALFSHFETFEQIAKASIEELNLIKGIDLGLAEKIYKHLHND